MLRISKALLAFMLMFAIAGCDESSGKKQKKKKDETEALSSPQNNTPSSVNKFSNNSTDNIDNDDEDDSKTTASSVGQAPVNLGFSSSCHIATGRCKAESVAIGVSNFEGEELLCCNVPNDVVNYNSVSTRRKVCRKNEVLLGFRRSDYQVICADLARTHEMERDQDSCDSEGLSKRTDVCVDIPDPVKSMMGEMRASGVCLAQPYGSFLSRVGMDCRYVESNRIVGRSSGMPYEINFNDTETEASEETITDQEDDDKDDSSSDS